MKLMIMLIIGFLVLVYVYTFIKIHKRRKNNSINVVSEFNQKYLSNQAKDRKESADNTYYKKYVTKFNSNIDYLTKEELNDTFNDQTY